METDFVIVGSGIAGLRAALDLAQHGSTLLLTKDTVAESATQYAQGGIAAAVGEDDAIEFHEQDTLAAGDGLCSPEAVHVLVSEAPAAINELLEWGAGFDREGSRLAQTREAAHSRSRILHAHGDSTGREIAETLARRALDCGIAIRPHALATRLLLGRDSTGAPCAAGVEFLDLERGRRVAVHCRGVLLATGGLGQVYAETTNPAVATGDGPALAGHAGARICDMEFVQFHPTALAFPGAPRFLLSEALRGEGAVLRNPAGERFLPRYHPAAELAPRDQVARAIEVELERARGEPGARASLTCYLDATHMPAGELARRFPRIATTLKQFGLDLARDWIPIRPAAHYAMGGIWTDLHGGTSIAGLYAAGEAACTGVHGANRLASNSLLEGLVFGARAGARLAACTGPHTAAEPAPAAAVANRAPAGAAEAADFFADAIWNLRRGLWQDAGVIRDAAGLERAQRMLEAMQTRMPPPGSPPNSEIAARWQSLAFTARAIVASALTRRESRGAHFRRDFPVHNPELAGCHSMLTGAQPVRFAPMDQPDR